MESDITAHLTTGAVIVYLLEWLKRSGWASAITADSKRINRTISAVLAAAAAIGINWTYSAADGTLIITGLTAQGVALGGWEWLKQFTTQQLIWDGIADRGKPTVIQVVPPSRLPSDVSGHALTGP